MVSDPRLISWMVSNWTIQFSCYLVESLFKLHSQHAFVKNKLISSTGFSVILSYSTGSQPFLSLEPFVLLKAESCQNAGTNWAKCQMVDTWGVLMSLREPQHSYEHILRNGAQDPSTDQLP